MGDSSICSPGFDSVYIRQDFLLGNERHQMIILFSDIVKIIPWFY